MELKECAEEAVAESFERWMMKRSTCWSCEERCLIPSLIQAFYHDTIIAAMATSGLFWKGDAAVSCGFLGYALMWSFGARQPIARYVAHTYSCAIFICRGVLASVHSGPIQIVHMRVC